MRSRQNFAATSSVLKPTSLLSGERRDTQQVESGRGLQGEHARVLNRGPDDVVVSERRAVVAIRIRDRISDSGATSTQGRALRPLDRDGTLDPGELRLQQDGGDEAVRGCEDGDAAEDFLVFDQLGSCRADSLQNQVEGIRFLLRNPIVVDRGPQEFARARIHSDETNPR